MYNPELITCDQCKYFYRYQKRQRKLTLYSPTIINQYYHCTHPHHNYLIQINPKQPICNNFKEKHQ